MIRYAPLRSLAAASVLLAACTPAVRPGTGPTPGVAAPPVYVPLTTGLPAIPDVAAPLAIRVTHPVPNDPRPAVDSTFIYGTVGTGGAALFINDTPVPVAPNGAFIAYLPVPASGAWDLRAVKGREMSMASVRYRVPATRDTSVIPAAPATPSGVTYARPLAGRVRGGADTLATGSDAVYARPTPTGTYRWFFPRGARLDVVERRRAQYRVLLEGTTSAWIDTTAVALGDSSVMVMPPVRMGEVEVRPAAGWVDVRIPAQRAAFLVEPAGREWAVTVYGATAAAAAATTPQRDAMLTGVAQEPVGTGAVRLRFSFARAPWGYKAFYAPDGALVLRLRRAPMIDAANPLRGRRIVIDPGHPPAGATGPTGLYEGVANLAIALPLAEKLRAAGAEVIMTRTTAAPLELNPRTSLAVRSDADLLISVHNNAFAENQNPFRAHGTSTYYFHPFSADLARALDQAIVGATRLPDLGARQSNLALVRPTWMPSALTESLFMPIPEQESALRDPGFIDRLAEAHMRGIEAFLRQQAAQ